MDGRSISSKSEIDIKLERLTEAVQANADSIKGVVQQMEVMSKEIALCQLNVFRPCRMRVCTLLTRV